MKIPPLVAFVLSSSLTLSFANATQFVSNAKAADVIYYGGPIVTLNDQQPTAQAVAVKNGKIVSVGSENSMRSWTGQKTEQVF